jgi:eukaryotic-like serine/threonine-protein kinase
LAAIKIVQAVSAGRSADLKQVSRYEILSELGRGAMGVVFKAQDPLIGRLIALKTITASVADDPGLLERFRREAKAAGALQHPNIVTIYEMGEADGAPFIAMEYLEGESLAALIDRHAPIPVAQKVGYLVQTCRALQYAHRHGVIHRDIKPANIVVTLEGEVKVVDFGIARLADASKTQTGTLLGTLAYIAPQQIRGKGGNALSDIWSLGVVLYELLTGRRPFQGENHAALMLSIMHNDPVPLRELLPQCPPQLDAISRRALAKDEAVRYQSMEELLLELKSAWAALHLNRPGQAPAAAARTAPDDLELQLVASRARTQVAQRAEKIGLGNLPAKSARLSALPAMTKAASIPSVPITATVAIPKAQSPGTANLAAAMPVKPRSWQRGIAFAAIGLVVLAGIGLEAIRLGVRYRTHASLPVAPNAQEAPPAAVNVIEDRPASSEKLSPDAQFNAALAHFHRAVVAKDAGSLKLLVRPEFQRIVQEDGPRAKDAAAYVSSAIPIALRGMTPWPTIRCGDEPDRETDFQLSSFVDCAALDPTKLQWVHFSWPEFPPQARQAGLDNGLAMLSLTVDQGGAVVGAWSRVQPDSFGFARSAMQAALKWKTTVPRAAGNPVETQISVDVPFSQ